MGPLLAEVISYLVAGLVMCLIIIILCAVLDEKWAKYLLVLLIYAIFAVGVISVSVLLIYHVKRVVYLFLVGQ